MPGTSAPRPQGGNPGKSNYIHACSINHRLFAIHLFQFVHLCCWSDDPKVIRELLLKSPHDIAVLKERNPQLADALLSNDVGEYAHAK